MNPHFVYGLVDTSSRIRYVGVTASPQSRVAAHSRSGKMLSALGGAIRHVIIAAVDGACAGREVERYFIQRLSGTTDLLNIRCASGAPGPIDFPRILPPTPNAPIRSEAARIVRERFAKGDAADVIAADYGVSRRAVYRWTTGRERPSRTVAGRIVAAEKARSAS